MTKYKIYNQDVIEWAKTYNKAKFHALLCDAPYHLTSIVKRFGKNNSAPARYGTDGVFSRSSKGFMGQQWDGGDIAFRPETWAALEEHLYPGAFGMAFSASRNWHRMAVAIEDAGFVIHPTIFGWLNGQGFPKATRIDKKVDYHDGSQNWIGHRYGLQALKPAIEPIIVFQKPYEGKPLDNIVSTGAGAINIDGGRIPLNGDSYVINTFDDGAKPWGDAKGKKYTSRSVRKSLPGDLRNKKEAGMFGAGTDVKTYPIPESGRWPSNFILSDGVWNADESRFFYNVQEQIDEADPIYYCAKVSPKERNAGLDERCIHPTLKPIALTKYLATLLLPPAEYAPRRILIPFSGVASEMIGAMQAGWEHIVGIEFDTENNYVDIAHKRMEYWSTK